MRPAASFTLHAILAACLAALAASSAAAKPRIDNEGHVWLSGAILGSHGTSQGGQLEVHSYHWGPRQSTARLKPARVTSYQLGGSGADAPPPSGAGSNELRMDDTAGKEKAQEGHSMLGASDRVTVGGARGESGRGADIARVDGQPVNSGGSGRVTGLAVDPADPASGQATGKRQHKPMVARGYYDQSVPPASGSLTVLASGVPCRIGARYPSLALSGNGKQYLLQDIRVVGCGDPSAAGPTEEVTFVYGKVTVRGWDPEKKED